MPCLLLKEQHFCIVLFTVITLLKAQLPLEILIDKAHSVRLFVKFHILVPTMFNLIIDYL